jgi:hypothetical protein
MLQLWTGLGLLVALAAFALQPTGPKLLWTVFGLVVIYFFAQGCSVGVDRQPGNDSAVSSWVAD